MTQERKSSVSSTGSGPNVVGMRKLSFSTSDERSYLDVMVPPVPSDGLRLRVCYAGLCYLPSIDASPFRKGCPGYRNGNIFEGFEVSAVVDSVGENVSSHEFIPGDPVVVFPDEETTQQGYSDYLVVHNLQNIVKLPPSISLMVGAMLPTGGTLAMSAVISIQRQVDQVIATKGHCNILIFGAGSLTHWLIALLHYANDRYKNLLHIIVASDDWEALKSTQKSGAEEVVIIDEKMVEDVIVDRLRGTVSHGINIAVCLTYDERSQLRAAKSLSPGGVLVLPEDSTSDRCILGSQNLEVVEVPRGNAEILRTLIRIIDQVQGLQTNIPAYKVYPVEESQKLYDDVQFSDEFAHERPLLDFEHINVH